MSCDAPCDLGNWHWEERGVGPERTGFAKKSPGLGGRCRVKRLLKQDTLEHVGTGFREAETSGQASA